MQVSRAFVVIVIAIAVIGLTVLGWIYLQGQEQIATMSPTVIVKPTSSTTEGQLKTVETDLKETETTETEFDTSEIEAMEKDLDPSQFDVL